MELRQQLVEHDLRQEYSDTSRIASMQVCRVCKSTVPCVIVYHIHILIVYTYVCVYAVVWQGEDHAAYF